MSTRHTACAAILLIFLGVGKSPADFIPLGALSSTPFLSRGLGVSPDGSVAVGESISSTGFEAFRWEQATGMVGLGVLSGYALSSASGVSSSGSAVVGVSSGPGHDEAFRWTQGSGMVG